MIIMAWMMKRISAFSGVVCAFVLFSTSFAHAGCVELVNAMALARQGFVAGQPPDGQRLNDLHGLIADMDNETILGILRNSGRGGDFSDLRNFLTQLKFMSQRMDPATIALSEKFIADLALSDRIVRSACMLPDGSIRSHGENENDSVSKSAEGIGARIQNRLKPLSSAQIKYLNENYNLSILFRFLFVFVIFTAFLILLHFAIIILRIVLRGRQICDVPATLTFMGVEVPVRLSLLGAHGCNLIPALDPEDAETEALSEGTYCQIQCQNHTVNARVIRQETADLGLRFQVPLTRTALNTMLQASDLKPRYDFSLLRNAQKRRLVFRSQSLSHN